MGILTALNPFLFEVPVFCSFVCFISFIGASLCVEELLGF